MRADNTYWNSFDFFSVNYRKILFKSFSILEISNFPFNLNNGLLWVKYMSYQNGMGLLRVINILLVSIE